MSYLASTYRFGTSGRANFSGQHNWISPGFDLLKRLYFPPYASAMERHPSVFSYGGRQYLLGMHTRNILIDEDLRCVRVGMQPPPLPPEMSVGGGAVPMIGYHRFYDEITNERSSLSDGIEVVGDVPRTWSNLPVGDASEEVKLEGTVTVTAGVVTGIGTTFGELRPGDRVANALALTRWAQVRSIASDLSMTTDDTGFTIGAGGTLVVKPVYRASHIEGWVAVNGTLPRLSCRARLGTTSIVESVASLALGEALIDSYEPMPTGAFGVLYNDRSIVAGVPGHLDTVYLSDVGFLERHGGLRFRTDYGESIVGMFLHANNVIVLSVTPDGEASYRLAGYTDVDYEMKGLEAKSGGVGHHGNCEVPGGIVLVPSSNGVQLFNGAFHPGMPTRQSEWMRDCRDNIAAFEGGFGAVNKNDGTYRFVPFVERIDITSGEPATFVSTPGTHLAIATLGGNILAFDLVTDILELFTSDYAPGYRCLAPGDDGSIYGAKDGVMRKLTIDTGGGTVTSTEEFTIGGALHFADLFQASDRSWYLYQRLEAGPNGGKIYHYVDGIASLEASYPAAPTHTNTMGAFGEIDGEIYVGLGNPPDHATSEIDQIARRNANGTWTPLTMPAGLAGLSMRVQGRPRQFDNKLWWIVTTISGTDVKQCHLLSVDGGTTVTLEHSVPFVLDGDTFLHTHGFALAVFNSRLYYMYRAWNASAQVRGLGYVDAGGTYVDDEARLSLLLSPIFTAETHALVATTTNLYALLYTDSIGDFQIFKSAGLNTAAAFTTHSGESGGSTPSSPLGDRPMVLY